MSQLISILVVVGWLVAIGVGTFVLVASMYLVKQGRWEANLNRYKANYDGSVTNKDGFIINKPSVLLDELKGIEERIANG